MIDRETKDKQGQDPIDRYRTALSMRQVMAEFDVHVPRSNKITCLNPDHSDRNPSFHLYEDHGYCFTCGFRTDVIGFVREHLGCSFYEALDWIADKASIPRFSRDPELVALIDAQERFSAIYQEVYLDSLKYREKAAAYLSGRGITGEANHGTIGYLPKGYKPRDNEAAREAGLYSSNGRFLYSDRVTIPIFRHGKIVSMYGRSLNDNRRPKHVYPAKTDPLMPPALWGLDDVTSGEVYLTEGIFDALTLRFHGYSAVAISGTSGLTDAKVAELKRRRIRKLILAFDSDLNGAGQSGVYRVGERLFVGKFDIAVVELPAGERKVDVNSYFVDRTAADFARLPQRDYWDWRCEKDISKCGTPNEKVGAARQLAGLVAQRGDSLADKMLLQTVKEYCPDIRLGDLNKIVTEKRRIRSNGLPTGKEFLPDPYADEVLSRDRIMHYRSAFWKYQGGVYRSTEEEVIKSEVMDLGEGRLRMGQVIEVIHSLRVKAFVGSSDEVNRPGIINLKNGYLDLMAEPMELLPHTPEILSTVQLAISYQKNATCPLFMSFLESKAPDLDLRSLLQEMAGYLLVPDSKFQKAFMLWGKTGTGKSTLLKALCAVIGSHNYSTIPLDRLGDRFTSAELDGKLCNITSDANAHTNVHYGVLKQIIAGDEITAERKFKDPYSFRPYCRIVAATNELPLPYTPSPAFFRRWIVIPMNEQLDEGKWDFSLDAKICERELPGVLAWALAGLARLREQGCFTRSKASEAIMDEWKKTVDPVAEYAGRRLITEPGACIPLKEVYKNFTEWCGETGRKALMTDSGLKKRLVDLGFSFVKRSIGQVLLDCQWANEWSDISDATVTQPVTSNILSFQRN